MVTSRCTPRVTFDMNSHESHMEMGETPIMDSLKWVVEEE